MTVISKRQAADRWDILPENLREALCDEENSNFIWKTCGAQFIPDAKIYTVSKITGWIIMGLVHPEDFTAEIAEALQIDRRIADVIAVAINQRIIAPLLPEIKKIKSLDAVAIATPPSAPAGPAIIATATTPAPAPLPIQPAAPKPLPEKGWSTMKVADIAPKPQPAAMPMPQTPTPKAAPGPVAMPAPMPMGTTSKTPAMPSSIPAAEAPKPAPMPAMMIQSDNAPKPIKNDPDFHITTKSTENIMPGGIAPMPIKAAVLELGGAGAQTSAPQASKAPTPEAAKVVHYSDLKSSLPVQLPLGKAPVAESGRHIMEMTAEAPVQGPAKPMPISTSPAITAKPGITSSPLQPAKPMPMQASSPSPMPTPVQKPPSAPIPIAPKPAMASSVAPKPISQTPIPMPPLPPKPTGSIPVPMPPAPPKAPAPLTPAASTPAPKGLPQKVIVKDFT